MNALQELSARLDQIIEFQYKTKYPKEVLESVWRRLKKPSRKTAATLPVVPPIQRRMTPEDLREHYRRMDEGHGDAIDEGFRRAVEEVRKRKKFREF